MKFKNRIILFFFIITGCALLPGCGGKNIYLSSSNYTPHPKIVNLTEYKNAKIYIGGFSNNAGNTDRYNYYGPNSDATYETESLLVDYFWYCFVKAFKEMGISVNEDYDAPLLYLMLNSMTDEECTFDINLYKGDDLVFVKEFTVKIPPTDPESKDLAVLERNAYKMINTAIAKILYDNNFKANVATSSSAAVKPVKKTEGTLVGIVKKINAGSSEIIVGSGKLADMVNIGDTIYVVDRGKKIKMKVKFPMQTIATCTVIPADKKRIVRIKEGDMVYK
ncbi:MAG: hypothetical protein JW864_17050 [Spirochaetes bacterium]|nr:hypothetical protein [Spirochaetota bacterium]